MQYSKHHQHTVFVTPLYTNKCRMHTNRAIDQPQKRRASIRIPSRRTPSKIHYDQSMPLQPPPRPNILRNRTTEYHPDAVVLVPPYPFSAWEEKTNAAQSYQEDVSGPSIPLTAEALRRRHAGSSRSTKLSGSRDESDYHKSSTTKSGSNLIVSESKSSECLTGCETMSIFSGLTNSAGESVINERKRRAAFGDRTESHT
jgi:hypothetical protein